MQGYGTAIGHKDLREAVQFMRGFLDGDVAEYYGRDMVSEWIGNRRIPIYLAADGPKALELAGELADGVIFMGGPPDYVKWKVEQIYRGAENAGRDRSKIDICVRAYVYVTDDKEQAHRELAGFVPFGVGVLHQYGKIAAVANVFERLEREQPGIVVEMEQFFAQVQAHNHVNGSNPWFEKLDAPYAHLMTMRQIECIHMVGDVDEICGKIRVLGEAGVTTVATANYTIIDKKRMITDLGEKIMPHFRN